VMSYVVHEEGIPPKVITKVTASFLAQQVPPRRGVVWVKVSTLQVKLLHPTHIQCRQHDTFIIDRRFDTR